MAPFPISCSVLVEVVAFPDRSNRASSWLNQPPIARCVVMATRGSRRMKGVDAACNDDVILSPCRGPLVHSKRSWLLDMVLAKE
jgi:hypothetical protein